MNKRLPLLLFLGKNPIDNITTRSSTAQILLYAPSMSEQEQPSTALLPLQANTATQDCIPLSQFPDISVFAKSTTYPALIIPVKRTAELRKTLSSVLLHRPKIKNVYANQDDDTTRKLVLSSEDAWQNDQVQALLLEDCTKSSHTITLTYNDCTVDEILRQVLPASFRELPAAFEVVGRIAHLNLRDELLPYKYIVGKVILDKNAPRIQTVVNKLGTIANEYRTFGMEVIAGAEGPNWSLATVKEEGCEFTLDFQHVYWNSRLGMEHKRLVQLIRNDAQTRQSQQQQGQTKIIVADLMAGVGPFAVPLTACMPTNPNKGKKKKSKNGVSNHSETPATPPTKAKIIVHANDLNPSSYKYLRMNAKKNKCPTDTLACYNMDARAFCHLLQDPAKAEHSGDQSLSKSQSSSPELPIDFHHAIMNLPASAPEFLDAFRGFTNPTLPRIHVYCFAPKPPPSPESNNNTLPSPELEEINAGVRQRCSTALGCPLDATKHNVIIRIVRDVSPKKNMVCVSFTLPEEARSLPRIAVEARVGGAVTTDSIDATARKGDKDDDDKEEGQGEPDPKRSKLSES